MQDGTKARDTALNRTFAPIFKMDDLSIIQARF